MAFQKPWNGRRNIYVKNVDQPFSEAPLLTAEPKRPIAGYFWSRNSKHYYSRKNKVEITAADDGADKETLWVARETQKPVKESAVLASLGRAVLTQELSP